jgi:hypothetical protein
MIDSMAYWLTIELEHGSIAPLPATMNAQGGSRVYGTTVPQILKQLDRFTQTLGVESIDNFIYKDLKGYTKILAEAESEANAVLAAVMRAEISVLTAQPRWHQPAFARRTIVTLKEFVTLNHHVLPGRNPQDTARWILWDLAAYELILADAESQGLKVAFVERENFN